jgi:putative tryptophan/tyrosine transport system substrate-binding protein
VIRRLLTLAVALAVASGLAVLHPAVAPAADSAQRIVRVGFVHPQSPSTATLGVAAFWERLRELGYVENENLIIETRWAGGRYEQLPGLFAEVIERKVDVLVTSGTPAAVAAKHATSTIPIVDAGMGDPVGTGLVVSLARPAGNLTGLSMGEGEGMAGKWLELLQEMVPRLLTIAVIANPDTPLTRDLAKDLEAVAPARGLKLQFIEVREAAALARAFEQAARKAQGVLLFPDSVIFAVNRWRIASFAAKYRLPAVYAVRDYADAGGLLSYGPDLAIQWRRAADYVDKILRGAKPGDLPVEQPTKFELVVNLKTAKALGLTIPQSILQRADEVIR